MRPRTFNSVVGQTNTKSIMQATIRGQTFPAFSAIVGDLGIGKSSLAEIAALALTCMQQGDEPCLRCANCQENLEALNGNGKSRFLTKVNTALLDDKRDVNDLIKEIFVLTPLVNSKVVYILEELQELPHDKQAKFLEELTRVPKDTYIIVCSSKEYKLLPSIKSRAFMFRLKPPTQEECSRLIDNLTSYLGIRPLSKASKQSLIRKVHNNPREIVNIITPLQIMDNLEVTLKNYLEVVDNSVYVKLLVHCYEPVHMYVDYINGYTEVGLSCLQVFLGLEDFLLDLYAYKLGRDTTVFSHEDKVAINKIFQSIDLSGIESLVLFIMSGKPTKETEAYFKLISLRNHLLGIDNSLIQKHTLPKAVQGKITAEREFKQKTDDSKSVGLKPVDSESVMNISKTSHMVKDKWGLPE